VLVSPTIDEADLNVVFSPLHLPSTILQAAPPLARALVHWLFGFLRPIGNSHIHLHLGHAKVLPLPLFLFTRARIKLVQIYSPRAIVPDLER